jgi:DNA-directed RNA polymerase subunit RPC12/RpoP
LGKELCKASWHSGLSLILGYTKLENGYVKDFKLYTKRMIIENGVKKAYKKVMRGWRKAYLREFLINMLRTVKSCPQCGHPMMANINGLNGIACPDCGYNPYVSIILCCECGDYEVIKTQPDISDDAVFNYINEYFRTRKDTVCKNCGKELLDEFGELRIIMLPIPIPFDEYRNIDVIYKNSPY